MANENLTFWDRMRLGKMVEREYNLNRWSSKNFSDKNQPLKDGPHPLLDNMRGVAIGIFVSPDSNIKYNVCYPSNGEPRIERMLSSNDVKQIEKEVKQIEKEVKEAEEKSKIITWW